MFIYIVRHAWAGEFGDPRWPNDNLRPLTEDGKARFQAVAKHLSAAGLAPAAIATSPLVRTRQTAEILAAAVAPSPVIEEVDALAPGSNLEELIAWSNRQEGDVAWVGHAPDVGFLAASLMGDGSANLRFAKGACAAIRFHGQAALKHGELYWHATAKLLGY
ncbi:MAG: histidine phosphatase family protein [Planctomycetales bacterium]|nr:histidine phosphatase family protein [Planctomycetales bacterium]